VVDLTFVPRTVTTGRDQRGDEAAANGPLKGVLAVTNDPLVSIDFNHIAASSTVALPRPR
jgi:glyceraldehyde 3-phosphate dehydrogenase